MPTVKLGEREMQLQHPADLADRAHAASGLSLAELARAVRSGQPPVLATAILILLDGDKPTRADLGAQIAGDDVDRLALGADLAVILVEEPASEPVAPAPALVAEDATHGE